jgi:hypothetical protein
MPVGPEDVVRPFQLTQTSPEQAFLSQYQLAANTPIFITPGFGASGSAQLLPIQTGTTHFESTTTFYCTAAQSERTAREV